jgi:hypothetical protein
MYIHAFFRSRFHTWWRICGICLFRLVYFFFVMTFIIFLIFLFIYSYLHTFFGPSFPPNPTRSLSPPLPHFKAEHILPFPPSCWRQGISNNKKDIAFLLLWDEDNYTERFLAFLPCTCVLQPKLIHLYLTASLLPGHLPIMTSCQCKITLFGPLQWSHQTFSSFKFPSLPLFLQCMFSP